MIERACARACTQANHASVMNGWARGSVAWEDNPDGWVEYGNPHSTMGNGDLEYFQADFMTPLKLIFDWISDIDVYRITPFDEVRFFVSVPRFVYSFFFFFWQGAWFGRP